VKGVKALSTGGQGQNNVVNIGSVNVREEIVVSALDPQDVSVVLVSTVSSGDDNGGDMDSGSGSQSSQGSSSNNKKRPRNSDVDQVAAAVANLTLAQQPQPLKKETREIGVGSADDGGSGNASASQQGSENGGVAFQQRLNNSHQSM